MLIGCSRHGEVRWSPRDVFSARQLASAEAMRPIGMRSGSLLTPAAMAFAGAVVSTDEAPFGGVTGRHDDPTPAVAACREGEARETRKRGDIAYGDSIENTRSLSG